MWKMLRDGGRRRLWRAAGLLCAAALLIGAGRAGAEPEPVLSVEVGHGGALRRDYYFPIRVKIDWVAKPGETGTGEAQAARLEVRVPQDTLYSAAIMRDVTIQPGTPTSVVVYARCQTDLNGVEVDLRDLRGRLLARTNPNSPGMAGWMQVEGDQAIVLAVGKSTLPRSGWVFDHQNLSPVKVEQLSPSDLPRAWPGYDDVSVVVLEDFQSAHVDALQIASLLEWVGHGGHLVVTVTNQLGAFNEVLGDQNWPLTFGEYNSIDFDPRLVEVLRNALLSGLYGDSEESRRGKETLPIEPEAAMGWFAQYVPDVMREMAALDGRYLYSREITLSPEALDAGWTARRAEEAFDPLFQRDAGRSDATGDIVAGPFGLGTVTILGIDPASLAGNARELRGVGWWHCLAHIEPLRRAIAAPPEQANRYYGGFAESLDSWLATAAANEVLDDLSSDFGVSHGLFGAISVALLLLVLLIGPVDYVVLRWMRREPLTWLTCPALVLLACVAIYFAQESVSYGTARVSRLSIVDAWSGSTRGTATSFTAIASARGGRYSLAGLGDGVHQSPTCWNPPRWYYSSTEPTTSVVIDQSSGGSHVRSLNIPLDSVRWLQDRGPIEMLPISGKVQFSVSRDTVWVDVIAPADLKCRVLAVQWNQGWYAAGAGGVGLIDGRLAGQMLERAGDDEAAAKWRQSQLARQDYNSGAECRKGWPHDLEFQIPGHRQISRRLDALGLDDAVVLIAMDQPRQVELTRDGAPVETEWEEQVRVRLLVPAETAPQFGGGDRP